MKKSLIAACLVAVLAVGGAVAWGASSSGDAGKRGARQQSTTAAAAGEAGQGTGSAPGAAQEPVAKPGVAAPGGPGEISLPTIPLPADAEQAKKVAALNEVIVAVTREAMTRPAGERMTQEDISELIRTRIRGVIPDQDTKGASQGNQ